MKFRGVMTAIVTPFQQGQVDEGALRNLVRKQIEGGVAGIVACGSTGEAATLAAEERDYVLRIVHDEVLGRVPVVAGVGARSTHEAIREAQSAEAIGCDGLLVVTPAYNKPTQAGLDAHFRAVAENTTLDLCLYNVPGRTGVDLLPTTVAKLAEHPRIVAIKEATGNMPRAAEIRRHCGPEFALMSGDDHTVLPFMALGGDGVISVISNVLPAPLVEMLQAIEWGNWNKARTLHYRMVPLMDALFVESNPIPVKTAAAWLGLIPSAELRLPLTPMSQAGGDKLMAALEEVGLRPVREVGAPSTLGPGSPPDADASAARTVELTASRLHE
jgi:4-hydroxy-tetrahydrodipicolinate synthase